MIERINNPSGLRVTRFQQIFQDQQGAVSEESSSGELPDAYFIHRGGRAVQPPFIEVPFDNDAFFEETARTAEMLIALEREEKIREEGEENTRLAFSAPLSELKGLSVREVAIADGDGDVSKRMLGGHVAKTRVWDRARGVRTDTEFRFRQTNEGVIEEVESIKAVLTEGGKGIGKKFLVTEVEFSTEDKAGSVEVNWYLLGRLENPEQCRLLIFDLLSKDLSVAERAQIEWMLDRFRRLKFEIGVNRGDGLHLELDTESLIYNPDNNNFSNSSGNFSISASGAKKILLNIFDTIPLTEI
ncbi:MAG: hypothetical protein HY430_01670 [Candidatus Levybacteria bacterium]|nr:hypothetical protein [Candidatus Levybacteria bacterium]